MKPTMLKPLLGALVISALLWSHATQAQTFYRWVDERGVTHYTDTPPEGQDSAEVRTRSSAPASQPQALEALEERRARDETAREETREQMREAQAGQLPQPDPTYCEQMRRNLDALENRPIVRTEDPETGQIITLDSERRAAMLDETRDALRACN